MSGDERLVGGHTGRMLAVTALAWATLQLARFAVPPLPPEIRADLGLSLSGASASAALAGLLVAAAVALLWAGRSSAAVSQGL